MAGPFEFRGAAWAILGGVITAIIVAAFFVGFMLQSGQQPSEKSAAVEYGPESSPPTDAPTIDYEEISGFDPNTQKRIDNRQAIEALTDRVERLEISLYGRSQGSSGPSGSVGELGEAPDTKEE